MTLGDMSNGTDAGRGKYAEAVAKALREHEPRHMSCSCGASIGDHIDRRWHEANAVAAECRSLADRERTPDQWKKQPPMI